MVSLIINLSPELDRELNIFKLKYDCRNERGNLDKREAALQILTERLFPKKDSC